MNSYLLLKDLSIDVQRLEDLVAKLGKQLDRFRIQIYSESEQLSSTERCSDEIEYNEYHNTFENIECLDSLNLSTELTRIKKKLNALEKQVDQLYRQAEFESEQLSRTERLSIGNEGEDMKSQNEQRKIENEIRSKKEIIDPLGCYCPETGTILIWIDKICDYYGRNVQVVFQKVLLHEFIHALLDLQPRDKSGNLIGQHIAAVAGKNWETGWTEETLDNALVLQCYKGTEYYEVIRSFIKHQPADYALALKVTDKELKNNLRSLILEKIK